MGSIGETERLIVHGKHLRNRTRWSTLALHNQEADREENAGLWSRVFSTSASEAWPLAFSTASPSSSNSTISVTWDEEEGWEAVWLGCEIVAGGLGSKAIGDSANT